MKRPYVILNAAMTLDGKIATVGGDSKISCEPDLKRLHKLRTEVDAVMVGAGTVLADDPSLTVRRVHGKNPMRVVVDGEAKTPVGAKVLKGDVRTIVVVSAIARRENVEKLRKAGAEVITLGVSYVKLAKLLDRLWTMGVRRILLEGGSTLNWNMLKEGLVDEVRVAISPSIVGGENAKTLVGGEGFLKVRSGINLRLVKIERVGTNILLTYRVGGKRC